MAAESLSELYLRLGLNYDDLQSDFISAEHTVQTNMGRLARENTSIRLQMEIDLQGLDEATDAQRIFEVRQRALNQQIANQRDRLNLANAALANARDRTGEYSNQTQRARIALEREQLALQHLEEELSRLNETQNESSGNVGSFLDGLQDIAGRAAPYVAGITAIAGALQTAADASVALIEKFRELQKQAYDLNMPFDKAKNFLRQIKLGGGDYGDFQGYIRGITDAYVKGEVDDPEFIALSRYGAQITDASGKLKDFQAITEEVYQAYKKAKAEGSEIEFLQLTGGESGVTDAIQFFERYEEAKEDAAKIFDSGINPNELHQAERSLNLLTEQVGEFKDALADVITPASKAAMDSLFETFRTGTEFIAENKKEIQSWGFIASEVFSTFKDYRPFDLLGKALSKINETFKNVKLDFGDETQNNEWQKFLQGIDEQNKNTFHNDLLDLAYGGIIERATEKQLEYNNAVKGATASWADFRKEVEQTADTNPLSQYGIQRVNQFKAELEDLKIELDFGDDEYGKAKAQNDLWLQRELTDKLNVSKEEETAIIELYDAKMEQIEREHDDAILKAREESQQKVQEMLRDSADIEFGLLHDAFEKQLYDIERWKQAQLEKADTAEEVAATIANAAMKEADAFEREMDRIKGKIESAQDKLARLTLSQYENDIRNAEKEYRKNIADSVPKELADAIYKAEMNAANKRRSEDKTGNYTQSPLAPNGSNSNYFINFANSAKKTTRSLIDMDAGQLAYIKTLENAEQSILDIDQALLQTGQATATYKDALETAITSSESTFDGLNNSIRDIDSSAQNLEESLNTVADNTANMGNSAVNSAKKIESAAETANRAMANFRAIEETKLRQNAEIPTNIPDKAPYDIIYLNDDIWGHNYRMNGIEVIYDDEPFQELDGLFQSVEPVTRSVEDILQQLPSFTNGVINGLLDGSINRYGDAYGADIGYGAADLGNFVASLEDLGMTTREAFGYLDNINATLQETSRNSGTSNITVSPNINVDLGGAYVFDNSMKAQLVDDITSEVVDAVKSAVQNEVTNSSYSYSN